VFPSASYQYVLYGMGFKPEALIGSGSLRPARLAHAQACFRDAATLTKRLLGGLPRHRDLIQHIRTHGMPSA
jgi:tryptophan 7-halogenase